MDNPEPRLDSIETGLRSNGMLKRDTAALCLSAPISLIVGAVEAPV